jgi:hypothetical protein
MPAYGNALSASETKALVDFLATLRGEHLPSAVNASRSLTSQATVPGSPR